MSESKTYIIAGSNSAIGKSTASILKSQGHHVLGISRSAQDEIGNYQVEKYDFGSFPTIDQKIHGLVYCPGTINLKRLVS